MIDKITDITKRLGSAFLTTSRELFARQYAISDEETIEQGFWRSTLPIEHNHDERLLLFEKIMEKKFCPGGRILAGAGTSHRNTLNCFVLAPNSRRFDYLDDVEDLVLKVAATTKVGGGIGINFDPFTSVQYAAPLDIEIWHTMDPDHPDYSDFVGWQYTDITAYGQPKRRYDRRGALIVDYSEREAMSAPIIVVEDSISAIFRAPFDAVRTGAKKVILDWSNLRPEGATIKGSGGTSSGAASFAIEVQHIIHWLSLGGHTAGPVNALRYVFQPVLRSVRQGGCLPASAMVHTNKGLISIRDIAVGDQVYTFNGLKPVTYKWDKGVQHLLTLKGRGTSFTATPEHKMAVLRDAEITYVPMKSISVGDTVLFNLTAHQFDQPQSLPAFDIEMDQQAKEITIPELDPDMAWFIGYFLGNGSTSAGKTVSIAYNSAYKEALGGRLERKIAGQLARFGTNVSHYNIANENTSAVRTVSSALAKYIQKHIKRSHETLRVPEFIAKGSIALRSAFIAGLMDSDGSVKTKPPRIVTTIYPEFATELQNLLATLGIPVRFSTQDRSAKGWHDLHTLSLVGFRHEYNQLIAPFSVKGELQSKKVRFDYSVPESSIKLHPRSYRGKWSGQGDMGYHTYLECSGDLPAIPIKVLEVAIADPQETWDIEVAGEENFIANGFHTHNSRRGAGMATLSISHPDADIFLSCKDHDVEGSLGEISAFNISFLARDEDMDNPFLEQVAHHAWLTGDPGLLFVDTINRDNPLAAIDGYILSTNPCFTGDMRLLTEDGWITFKDAAEHGKPLKIIQDSRISYTGGDDELPSNWKIDPHNADPGIIQQASHAFLTKRNAEVVQLEFADGTTLRLTPDHLVATTVGMIEAQNLTEMHEVLIGNAPETESIAGQWPKTADEHMGFLMGLLASDGTYANGKTTEAALIDLFNEAMGIEAKVVESIEALWDVFKSKYMAHKRPFTPYSITRLPHKLRIKSSFLAAVLKGEYGFSRSTKSQVPKRLMENSRHKPALFYLAAFTYCDGTVNTHTSCRDIRINQSNKKLLEDIQLMLSGAGISSKVYLRRTARWKSMPDGKGGHKDYWTKDNYELVITKDRGRFLKIVGILRGTKQDKLEGIVKSIGDVDHKPETTYVLSITPAGREDVYCIHENVRRSLIVEKVCARRCGEVPLYPGEPCDLGAINLLKYVAKNSVFNASEFANDVGLYVRYLDGNLDYAILPTEQSRVMSQRNRRIGLGVMGLAHALIKMGLRYDSQKGREAAWKIFRTMAIEADQESVNMSDGKQRMSIPFERHNIALLTVAPTGTTSMIMDVSSGIEPIFSVTYRRKIGSEDKIFMDPLLMEMLREHDPHPDYVLHEGRYVDWNEEKVVEAVQKNGGSLRGLNFIPKYMQDLFQTSHEIHYRDHIAMQAAAQDGMNYKHVGNSISKTINMPHSATVDDVLDAYRYAHSMGCKGITIYRDGSRMYQVLNTDTEISLECPTGVCEI